MSVPDALKDMPPFGGDESKLLYVKRRLTHYSFEVVERSAPQKHFAWTMRRAVASEFVAALVRVTSGADTFTTVEDVQLKRGTFGGENTAVHLVRSGKYYSFVFDSPEGENRFVWSMHHAEVTKLTETLRRMLTTSSEKLMCIEGVSIGGPPDPSLVIETPKTI
jgi:hypothetical protein